MMDRVLLVTDDSPGGLAAARTAIELAERLHARLRAVQVVRDHAYSDIVASVSQHPDVHQRRESSASALLERVAGQCHRAGVGVETGLLFGDPVSRVLAEAKSWRPEVIVISRSPQAEPGWTAVSDETAHILEFAEQPVLVVPPPHRTRQH